MGEVPVDLDRVEEELDAVESTSIIGVRHIPSHDLVDTLKGSKGLLLFAS